MAYVFWPVSFVSWVWGSFGGQVDSCRSMTDGWKKKGLGLASSGMSSLYGIVSPPLLFVAKDLRNLYEYIPQRG